MDVVGATVSIKELEAGAAFKGFKGEFAISFADAGTATDKHNKLESINFEVDMSGFRFCIFKC